MNIHQSLEQVYESQDLLGSRFYEHFFASCPEAESYFEGVDMHRQAVVVTMALTLVEQYYHSPYRATEDYLLFLGDRHQCRLIPLEMYPKWLNAMMETLKEFHGDSWDESLASQWWQALNKSTDKLLEGYTESVLP